MKTACVDPRTECAQKPMNAGKGETGIQTDHSMIVWCVSAGTYTEVQRNIDTKTYSKY